jgi:hypothetical protein
MASETADWVFESVLQFLKSPAWTTPVHGFIEDHCDAFDPEEPENKVEYTVLHKRFCELVDTLLTGFLEDLGVSGEDFIAACRSGSCPELSDLVTEYIFSMDDFVTFRAMMERHNHELELEAMYEYAKIVGSDAHAAARDDEISEEERFLLEMAIKASLQPADVAVQEAALQDAELLQALAMSLALEQERLMREQMAADDAAEKQRLAAVAEGHKQDINAEFLRQREENAARAAAAPTQQQAPPTAVPATSEQQAPTKPSVTARVLAPVGDRRVAPAFGAKPLPSIGGAAGAPPPTTAAQAPQPTFTELVRQSAPSAGGAPAAAGSNGQPTDEQMQQRAAYLKAQREALLKAKRDQRESDLAEYEHEKKQQQTPDKPAGAKAKPDTTPSQDADAAARVALARRFKEDLLQETRKAAAKAGPQE